MYKILIADDELLECRGLEWMIHNSFPEAEVLPYVQNGIDLIRAAEEKHPDLILLDINMPGLSGLEALEIIRMKQLQIRVILVTAYRDFSYAQKAICLGARDYILKPAQKDRVKAVVQKQLEELNQERQQLEENRKHIQIEEKYERLLMKQLIARLLLDGTAENEEEQMQNDCRQLRITNEESLCAIIEEMHGKIGQETADRIVDILRRSCGVVWHAEKGRLYLILFADGRKRENNAREWTAAILEPLFAYMKRELRLELRAGISSWNYECARWRTAFHECKMALYKGTSGKQLSFFETKDMPNENEAYFSFAKNYLKFVKRRSYEEAAAALEVFLHSPDTRKELTQLRLYSIDLLYEVWKLVNGRSLTEDISGCWKSWKELLGCPDRTALLETLPAELRSIMERPFEKKNYQAYVKDSLHYMREMYAEGLSLDDVAQEVGITPFYLSRLFKQEVEQTFLECLTDIRLIRAMEFVYQGGHTAKEISWSVGYPNSNYFYKIFKKATGVTLGELKEFVNEKGRHLK